MFNLYSLDEDVISSNYTNDQVKDQHVLEEPVD